MSHDPFFNRQYHIKAIFILAGLLLAIQSAILQFDNSNYEQRIDQITIRELSKIPPRGIVYDDKEQVLTYNEPIYDVMVTVSDIEPDIDTSFFCQLLDISKETFEKNMQKNWSEGFYSKRSPFIFLKDVETEAFSRFQEHLTEFKGFSVAVRDIRSYSVDCAANILGYISEVNREQLQNEDNPYTIGDYVGQRGIELQYDSLLRGTKGKELILKNNKGRTVEKYNEGSLDVAATAGTDLYTTINLELQRFGESLLQNKTGSIVAIDPTTGSIKALVSSPSYDPNQLRVGKSRSEAYRVLEDNPNKPFLDRSVNAKYPPGSIFKTIVGLVALEEGLTHEYKSIHCPGYYQNGPNDIRGCRNHPHPSNIRVALQHSCNTYFFQLFKDIVDIESYNQPQKGFKLFENYLTQFGLGKKLELDFPAERSGNIPSAEYYDRQYGARGWKSPTVISLGIGQGELELTTLQMANLAAIIANRGHYFKPQIVAKAISPETGLSAVSSPQKKIVQIDPTYFEIIVQGMNQVVKYGTGYSAHIPGIEICGKTGTTQNVFGEDHSVFFGFAPLDNPQIALAVYVENAGGGSTVAAPIGGLVIEKYLNGEISPLRQGKVAYIQNIVTENPTEIE